MRPTPQIAPQVSTGKALAWLALRTELLNVRFWHKADIPSTALTKRLWEVTDDFLIKENRDRPDVLKQLKGPSIVPR